MSGGDVCSEWERKAKDIAIGGDSSVWVVGANAWVGKGLTACRVFNRLRGAVSLRLAGCGTRVSGGDRWGAGW